jgi:hypothetical protein
MVCVAAGAVLTGFEAHRPHARFSCAFFICMAICTHAVVQSADGLSTTLTETQPDEVQLQFGHCTAMLLCGCMLGSADYYTLPACRLQFVVASKQLLQPKIILDLC